MHITVTGKQIDVGDALRRHTQAAIENIAEKYFGNALEAHVVFSREAHLIQCDLQVHVGRGILVRSEADANEAYAAFDIAAERIDKRLRRYKRRLRDHHAKAREPSASAERAMAYVLAPVTEEPEGDDADGEGAGAAPAVVAEMSTELPNLTVGEAVMRMDLADALVLLFRNRSHGELNLVYRRPDGNIGWIDPELDPARRTRHRFS